MKQDRAASVLKRLSGVESATPGPAPGCGEQRRQSKPDRHYHHRNRDSLPRLRHVYVFPHGVGPEVGNVREPADFLRFHREHIYEK